MAVQTASKIPAELKPADGRFGCGPSKVRPEALAALGIDGLSAKRLSARYRPGPGREAWLRAPISPPEPRPRPTLALILRLPLS